MFRDMIPIRCRHHQLIEAPAEILTPIALGDSDKARVGEFAIAIGAPFELEYSDLWSYQCRWQIGCHPFPQPGSRFHPNRPTSTQVIPVACQH